MTGFIWWAVRAVSVAIGCLFLVAGLTSLVMPDTLHSDGERPPEAIESTLAISALGYAILLLCPPRWLVRRPGLLAPLLFCPLVFGIALFFALLERNSTRYAFVQAAARVAPAALPLVLSVWEQRRAVRPGV